MSARASSTVIAAIEAVAPLAAAASWDHSGVQIAGLREEISSLAVCLDPTPAAVGKALAAGADFILAHHPLSMSPQYLDKITPYYEVAAAVLSAGAWLYSAHTSLDANPAGPSGWFAREMGLKSGVVLEETWRNESGQIFGFGLVGDLPAPMPFAACCARVRELTRPGVFSLCGPRPETVRRLAVCGGSGSSFAETAYQLGADVLVTGDVKYHTALESPLCIMDVGHFSLEEEMTRRLALGLEETLPGVSVTFFAGSDPFAPDCSADPNPPAPPQSPAKP